MAEGTKNKKPADSNPKPFWGMEGAIIIGLLIVIAIFVLNSFLCVPLQNKSPDLVYTGNQNIKFFAFITTKISIPLLNSDSSTKKYIEEDSCGVQFHTKEDKSLVYFFNHTYGWVDSDKIYKHKDEVGGVFLFLALGILVVSVVSLLLLRPVSFYYAKLTNKTYKKDLMAYDKRFHSEEVERLEHLVEVFLEKTLEAEHYSTENLKNIVLENDALLGKILAELNTEGVTLGELLQNVKFFDQNILRKARSAHAIRNMVAHSIADSTSIPRERIIQAVYDSRKVFKVLKVELQRKKTSLLGK